MHRRKDGKLMLIDFGVSKNVLAIALDGAGKALGYLTVTSHLVKMRQRDSF
jgi:hypothetical protein